MNNSRTDRQENESAVSLVEFALVLPILVFLIMGAFDLGWAVYINNSAAVSAREGARRAIIVASTNDSVCSRVQAGLQGIALTCTYQNNAPSGTAQGIFVQPATRSAATAGKNVTVTVQFLYRPITPLFTPFFPTGLMLGSAAVMVAE